MKTTRTPKKVKKLDRSDFVSLLAILISLGAFGVSIYEARILKEQQELMQMQQAASVWPYLEHEIMYSYDTVQASILFAIGNKGVGPARIDHVAMELLGEPIEDYNSISNIVRAYFPPNTTFSVSYASPDGVLSADETYQILQISSPRFEGDTEYYRNIQLNFQICYCSIYHECWTLTDKAGEPEQECSVQRQE